MAASPLHKMEELAAWQRAIKSSELKGIKGNG